MTDWRDWLQGFDGSQNRVNVHLGEDSPLHDPFATAARRFAEAVELRNGAAHTAYCHWFGIQPGAATVLTVLYSQKGHPLTMGELADKSHTTPGTVEVQLVCLRKALDDEAIDHIPGQGYALTESGMSECRAVLWTVGEELRRAS